MKKLNQIPENIQILIVSFLDGAIDKEGIESLNSWISESDVHLQLFNTVKSAWLLSGKKAVIDDEKTMAAMYVVKKEAFKESRKIVSPFWNISRVAVSWLLIFIIGGVLGKYITHRPMEGDGQVKVTTISAPLGSKSEVKLPDGSKVWLNAGSNISYDSNFEKSDRKVILTGEAYFDVTKNEKAPFLIKTNKNITIKVLGTAFNVKAYPEENYVETTVERGKVQVTRSLPGTKQINTVTLLPKQKLKIEYNNAAQKKTEKNPSENILQSNVETKVYTSWKDGVWIIESESLESIAVKIERNYNVNIEFKDPELKKYVFTGLLKNETLEQVLELIKLSAPIKFHIDKQTVILTKNRLINN